MSLPTAPSGLRAHSPVLRGAYQLVLLLLPILSFATWLCAYLHWNRDLYFREFTAGMLFPALAPTALKPVAFWAGFGTALVAAVAALLFRRRPALRRWARGLVFVTSGAGLLVAGYGIVIPSVRWDLRIHELQREAASFPSHRFAGAYPTGDGLTGTYLVLTPERFLYEQWGCMGIYGRVFGEVSASGEELLLTPDPQVAASWGGESLRLSILRWGGRTYAIDSWAAFCRAIAWSSEPRSDATGEIFLRHGDWDKPAAGPPPLPATLSRCHLGPPKTSSIIEVVKHTSEARQPYTTVVLDAGLEQGVLPFTEIAITVHDGRTPLQGFIERTQIKTSESELSGVDVEVQPGDRVTFVRRHSAP